MAQFKYTLPSGSQFTMNASENTTQAEADKIFYEQVAAGAFVGYRLGDTLTTPESTFANFGLSRLQRGTAGVDEQAILAIIANLPVVASIPSLNGVIVVNPIDDLNFIQVNSNTTDGVISLGPTAIGTNGDEQLSSTQVQALLAQISAVVVQAYNVITQALGIGKFGFNSLQLERAGYIKPGYSDRYCRMDASTQANPPQFISFMNSPSPWTGKDNVTSINDILSNEALQNRIQGNLMKQSYETLVAIGTIIPPVPKVSTPSISTGHVYDADGALVSTSVLSLLTTASGANPYSSSSLYGNTTTTLGNTPSITGLSGSTQIGTVPAGILALGTDAVATYKAGLGSLSTGAMVLNSTSAININADLNQLTGLAGSTAAAAATINNSVTADIGALVANASKYGTQVTQAWATGTQAITNVQNIAQGAVNTVNGAIASANSTVNNTIAQANAIKSQVYGAVDGLKSTLGNATDQIKQLGTTLSTSLDALGKASKFSIDFSNFKLSSLVSRVEPAAAFTGTVNRGTLDAAVNRIIGSGKIEPPVFELPSLASLGIKVDISQAKAILSQAQTAAQSITTTAQNINNQAQGIVNTAQGLQGQVTGTINGVQTKIGGLFG